jgi:hypothetical protein
LLWLAAGAMATTSRPACSRTMSLEGNLRETENSFPEGGHSCPPCSVRQECRTSEELSDHLLPLSVGFGYFVLCTEVLAKSRTQ